MSRKRRRRGTGWHRYALAGAAGLSLLLLLGPQPSRAAQRVAANTATAQRLRRASNIVNTATRSRILAARTGGNYPGSVGALEAAAGHAPASAAARGPSGGQALAAVTTRLALTGAVGVPLLAANAVGITPERISNTAGRALGAVHTAIRATTIPWSAVGGLLRRAVGR